MTADPEETGTSEGRLSLHIGPLPVDARIAVYSTIILMSGFALYDPGDEPLGIAQWAEVLGAVLSPLVAVGLAHAFADLLGYEVHSRRAITAGQQRHILLHNLQFLYMAAVTLMILLPMLVLRVPASTGVNIVLLLGLAALVAWGTFAGRRVGLGLRGTLGYAAAYGAVGLLVVVVKYWLTH